MALTLTHEVQVAVDSKSFNLKTILKDKFSPWNIAIFIRKKTLIRYIY